MRKLLSLTFACTFVAIASFARAQQLDIAVGGNELWSPRNLSASVGYIPPPEKGGIYPSVSVQYILANHFGFNAESAFRYHKGIYDNFQPYRPIMYDLNGVYAPPFRGRVTGNFMGGIGAQTVLFYNEFGQCTIPVGGCRAYLNSTHFMTHLGAGVRYRIWRDFFVRPEVHWYYVVNNFQLHSDNVFRFGASV